jgi:large subunit ribosomal protein L10
MNPDKKLIVDQLLQRLESTPYLLLVDYTGLTVSQFGEIRKRLRGVNAKFHVTKNSYIKAAGAAKNYPAEIEKALTGQTAVVFGEKDVCAAAKVIAAAHKELQKPVLKCGVLDGKFLTAADVEGLAEIGSRENLLAKLLGLFNAPAGALARTIAARIEKEGGAPAPVAA